MQETWCIGLSLIWFRLFEFQTTLTMSSKGRANNSRIYVLSRINFDRVIHYYFIIFSSHDTSFKIWNKETYEELSSLGGHTGSISSVVLISEDRAATGSQDCSIKIWDVKKGK